jgi:RNA polymerase sigma-70 factor (ECF subfamily)
MRDQPDPPTAILDRFTAACLPLRKEVLRYVRWLSRDSHLAEDVVQEVFTRAWRHIDGLRDPAAAKSWLMTTARRELARAYSRNHPRTIPVDTMSETDLLATSTESPEDTKGLAWAFESLPPPHRDALVMQVTLGYSTEEIASCSGSTPSAVGTRLFRARQKLRALL